MHNVGLYKPKLESGFIYIGLLSSKKTTFSTLYISRCGNICISNCQAAKLTFYILVLAYRYSLPLCGALEYYSVKMKCK